jgi:arylsulfatase A-like enzyme
VATPNLQRFAEQGVLFRNAFDAAPTCSPSRAALLTGMAPHNCGMFGLAHRGFGLNDKSKHLASYLASQGYSTALSGVQHETTATTIPSLGYQEVLLRGGKGPEVSAAASDFLARRHTRPFFLSVGYFETHREFYPPTPKEDARYTLPPAPLPDTTDTRADMAAFKASARVLDDSMGAVFAALDRHGLASNTIVVCTTDHGIAFPTMKCNLTGHGMGVMLMLRGPGIGAGKVSESLVSHLDVFPTLCDLAGLSQPAWLQGRSMRPLLNGESAEIRDEVHGEVTYHAAYEPARSVRTKRFNYVRRFDGRGTPNLPNCDDGLSKSYWIEQGWKKRPMASEELFDLVFDPNETRNVVSDPAHAGTLAEMRRRLESWMRATSDPLLSGPVPAPRGAKLNDPEGLSPRETPRTVD